jgi:hypothetical protein
MGAPPRATATVIDDDATGNSDATAIVAPDQTVSPESGRESFGIEHSGSIMRDAGAGRRWIKRST